MRRDLLVKYCGCVVLFFALLSSASSRIGVHVCMWVTPSVVGVVAVSAGNLELQIRPMAYKGTSSVWMRSLSMSQQEDWTEELAIPDGPMATNKHLKQMACPKCGHMKSIDDDNGTGKVGFSMIKYKRCHNATSASLWRCDYKLLWHKCDVHMLRNLLHKNPRMSFYLGRAKHLVRRVSKSCLKGQDKPFPRRKCMGSKVAIMNDGMQ